MRNGRILACMCSVAVAPALWAVSLSASPAAGFTNMETNGAPYRHTYGDVPASTTPVAGMGNFGSAGEYAQQAGSNRRFSNGNSEGNNDAFGNYDGSNTYADVHYVISGFGEWPVAGLWPNQVTMIAGFRLNSLCDTQDTPSTNDDTWSDQNFAFQVASVVDTRIPSTTNGLTMNLYIVRDANLGQALRGQTRYRPFQGTLGAQTRQTDIQIAWDWFQAGRHSGAFGDFYTVTDEPDIVVSTNSITLFNGSLAHNLSVGNTGPRSRPASILTGIACLYNDSNSVFSVENHLGESWSGGLCAEVLPITNTQTRANAVVVKARPGVRGVAKLDLYFNDPETSQTVQTINLVSLGAQGTVVIVR